MYNVVWADKHTIATVGCVLLVRNVSMFQLKNHNGMSDIFACKPPPLRIKSYVMNVIT